MEKKLSILMICKTLPWQFKGGIQTHTWMLAKELENLGHQVSLLTSGSFKKPESTYTKDGIQIIQVPYLPGRRLKFFNIAAEELAFNWSVRKWVDEHHIKFDVIHAQGRSGYLLYSLADVHHKLINTVHGLIDIEGSRNSIFNLNKLTHSFIAKHFENKLLQCTKKVIAVSETLKSDINKNRAQHLNATVVPNGVERSNEPMMLGLKPSKFLFIGRLHPIKGIKDLVNVMDKASTEIQLDIIGNGTLKAQIAKLIEKKGMQHQVRLLGEKSSEEIKKLIPQYNALVLPSHYETQGIVILEANALAVPVIASDIPAIRESVKDGYNGLLCSPQEPLNFIKAMEKMASNPIEAQCMGIRGKKMVESTYDWKIIGEKIERIYYKVAG